MDVRDVDGGDDGAKEVGKSVGLRRRRPVAGNVGVAEGAEGEEVRRESLDERLMMARRAGRLSECGL